MSNLEVYANILEKTNKLLEAHDYYAIEITQEDSDSTLSKWQWNYRGYTNRGFDSFEDALASLIVYLMD